MNIYVFSSSSLTNVWAGIGARTWAISENQAGMSGAATKAARMRIGSLGLVYCSETHEVTTPFVVTSRPDTTAKVGNVWADTWHFPFRMTPLGSPMRTLHKDVLGAELPSVVATGRQWNKILLVQPQFVFQASEVSEDDWEYLYSRLHHD
jgi:hypothetical protein